MPEIRNYAHDLLPCLWRVGKSNVIANRVCSRKILFRESLVDDGNRTRLASVPIAEWAPGEHGNLQCREVLGADREKPNLILHGFGLRKRNFDPEPRAVRTFHGERVCDPHRFDTRHQAHTLLRLMYQSSSHGRVGVTRRRQRGRGRQNVARVIPQTRRFHVQQTAEQ